MTSQKKLNFDRSHVTEFSGPKMKVTVSRSNRKPEIPLGLIHIKQKRKRTRKDQRTSEKDQRINGKHFKEFFAFVSDFVWSEHSCKDLRRDAHLFCRRPRPLAAGCGMSHCEVVTTASSSIGGATIRVAVSIPTKQAFLALRPVDT